MEGGKNLLVYEEEMLHLESCYEIKGVAFSILRLIGMYGVL